MNKERIAFLITVIIALVVFLNFRAITLKAVELTTPKYDPKITYSRTIDGIELERDFGL